MPAGPDPQNRANLIAGIFGLRLLASCARPPPQMATVVPGPRAPAAARLWLYRVDNRSLGRNVANVDLNGARTASVPPGAGPAIYVKVLDEPNVVAGAERTELRRDTFYTLVVPLSVARRDEPAAAAPRGSQKFSRLSTSSSAS